MELQESLRTLGQFLKRGLQTVVWEALSDFHHFAEEEFDPTRLSC